LRIVDDSHRCIPDQGEKDGVWAGCVIATLLPTVGGAQITAPAQWPLAMATLNLGPGRRRKRVLHLDHVADLSQKGSLEMDDPRNSNGQMEQMNSRQTAIAELTVEGMHCQSCASLIEEILLDDSCVAGAVVDLDAARAMVTYFPEMTSVDHLCELVTAAGYQSSPASLGDVAS
jgi:copper chaperone CopZ